MYLEQAYLIPVVITCIFKPVLVLYATIVDSHQQVGSLIKSVKISPGLLVITPKSICIGFKPRDSLENMQNYWKQTAQTFLEYRLRC